MENTSVNLNHIKELILQIDSKERIELAKFIDKLTLKKRFENLLKKLENIPITFNEITNEVEKVREEMSHYNSSGKKWEL